MGGLIDALRGLDQGFRVDGVDPLDDTLRMTTAAAVRYDVPTDLVEAAVRDLMSMDDAARRRAGLVAMHDAVLHVADRHGGPHDACDTCTAVRDGLSVALSVVRAEFNVDFERRI